MSLGKTLNASSSQLATVHLKRLECKLATARLLIFGSIPELRNMFRGKTRFVNTSMTGPSIYLWWGPIWYIKLHVSVVDRRGRQTRSIQHWVHTKLIKSACSFWILKAVPNMITILLKVMFFQAGVQEVFSNFMLFESLIRSWTKFLVKALVKPDCLFLHYWSYANVRISFKTYSPLQYVCILWRKVICDDS